MDQLADYQSIETASTSAQPAPGLCASLTVELFTNILDGIDHGLIVVRGSGDIVYANQLARTELDSESTIRVRNDRLSTHSAKNTLAIERAILDARNGVRRLVEIPSNKANITLAFTPVSDFRDRMLAEENIPPQFVLILIGKRTPVNAIALTEFGRIHSLSPAEQRLLPAICRGASIKEMARDQRISPCTIRVHLKSIRHKTGSPSLRPLMLQLMTLPPLLSATEM